MSKSVAIVGASASGLRVAKELLQTGRFDVTIFEKNVRVGGLWAVTKDTIDGMLDPSMPTNIDRYCQGFSDLSWDSVDYGPEVRRLPLFPKAWQVGAYLEAYRAKFIPRECLRLGCKITNAELIDGQASAQWKLCWDETKNSNEAQTGVFDYLVLASGFFAAPRPLPESILEGPRDTSKSPKVIHSTQLRKLSDVLPEDGPLTGKILVIGGGISGADAAASLGLMLSSARYSPAGTDAYKGLQIAHVFSRHFYALPLYVRASSDTNTNNAFLSWSCFMYDLGRRPAETRDAVFTGLVPATAARNTHKALRGVVGSHQGLIHPALMAQSLDEPPYVALNNLYAEFVRSEVIEPIKGRVTKLSESNQALTARVSGTDSDTELEDVVGVVYATGYTPIPALDFLSDQIKTLLEFDRTNHRLPVILQDVQTHNPAIPNLAFVGFYEGPHWPVIEMQSRLITKRWLNSGDHKLENVTELDKMRDVRAAIAQKDQSVPQFWMADYLGLMQTMAKELGITRIDNDFGVNQGPVVPFRYLPENQDQEEAFISIEALTKDLDAARNGGKFAAAAAFRGLQGRWALHRKLESAIPSFPSGMLTGLAYFHPRYPTDPDYDAEYLYIEEGTFNTRQGFQMRATRSYVYRYSEATDTISVWFVKADGKTVDYIFHNIGFSTSADHADQCWQGKADHLCVEDMYRTSYKFDFDGASLTSFKLYHKVDGPKKDYFSDSDFCR